MSFVRGKRDTEELEDYFELEPISKQSKYSKAGAVAHSLLVTYREEKYETYPFPNVVSVSSKVYADLGKPAFLQIGRFVVPVRKSKSLKMDTLEMFNVFTSCLIYKQPGEVSNRKIKIKPFTENLRCRPAKSVTFEVKPWRDFDYIGKTKDKTVLLEDILRWETIDQLGNQIVRTGQDFFLRHPIVGPLQLTVKECHVEGEEALEVIEDVFYPEFAQISRDTHYSFKTGDNNKIIIVEEGEASEIREFCVRITKVKEIAQKGFHSRWGGIFEKDWHRGLDPLPVVVPLELLKDRIYDLWEDVLIYPDKTGKFSTHDREFTIKVTAAKVFYGDVVVPEGKNLKAFRLNRDHHIQIGSDTKVILTDSVYNAQPATELNFKICEVKRGNYLEKNQLNWLDIDAIIAELKTKLQYLPLKSKCTVCLRNILVLIKLVGAKGTKIPEVGNAKQLWCVTPQTRITLFCEPKLHLELLHGSFRTTIQTMQVIVTRKIKEDDEGKQKLPKVILNEATVAEAFKHAVPTDQLLSENQVIHGCTSNGIKLTFKLRQIRPTGAFQLLDGYGILNKFDPQTKITWIGEKDGDVSIEHTPREVDIGKIHDELIEAGLGGLPPELEKLILEIKLSRGPYNNYMKELGLSPTRGIILWGPPGTGKTQIARNLGKILGISEERTKLYTGSEIWDKYVGNSEKNVAKMFEAAREEQNRLGDKSPMHLLIIDEIDAFLQKRSGAKNRWETSVVTTFLAQLDGITSLGKEPLNNIIVIGMTNQPQSIDEAVKREGRLGTHIHIGLPDHHGRKEIFMIHAKKLIAKGSIASEVNFDKLAESSSGKTGAFIEGIVSKAAKYSITRMYEAKVQPNDPLAKVTMADFKQAFKEGVETEPRKKKEEFVPVDGTSTKIIANNLRRLGIVGVPTEVLEFIRDCKIAQTYKGLELPSAVLLYGHPGTGKSLIARSLAKMLGIETNQFHYFSASQLWPKRGSDFKESMSAMIQPAKDASRDLGKGAPLHIIVVDEIDWIYSESLSSDKQSGVMMSHFLREIHNLFYAEGFDVNNLMIVGIASGRVPSDIMKGFNVGTSVKLLEVKLPHAKERRIILEYYLEEFIKENRIDEKTLDELVEISKDKSGSFLKAWVKETVNKMYRRAADQEIPENELGKHACGKLLLDDFKESYSTLAGEERWRNTYI